MPLVSRLGEQSLNATIGVDQPGRGVWLIPDSDGNLFGLVEEYRAAEYRVSAFFLRGDEGQVTPRYEIGADTALSITPYDQDAFLIYPADGDFEVYQPITLFSETPPSAYEGDLADFPPAYLFDDGAFLRDGEPAGRDTTARFDGNSVRVYEAPDGDGTGIFVDVRDGAGNRLGGVVRVNDAIAGDQSGGIVGGLPEAFSVAWTQTAYDGANAETYRAKTFDLSSNIGLAITRDVASATFAGDRGDYVTDIFLLDTAAGDSGRLRVVDFGANDIFVTTTQIADANGDGIITFGRDKRLALADETGETVASVAFSGGVRALEYDGAVEGSDGRTYYVYSRVGSAADDHYLIA